MINCNKVTKKYQNQIVLDNFTYNFKSTGFYLLFGESGSGKNYIYKHIIWNDGV